MLRKVPRSATPVSICARSPDWYHGLECKRLAPSYQALAEFKLTGDAQKFTEEYREDVLSRMDAEALAGELQAMVPTQDVLLVCFEKQGDFCHRHLVADWFRQNGVAVEEWF